VLLFVYLFFANQPKLSVVVGGGRMNSAAQVRKSSTLFAWLIRHQSAVLFSHNKPATSNQPAVLFSQNKSAPAISHQPNEHAAEQRNRFRESHSDE
jgi:hypothetical protein